MHLPVSFPQVKSPPLQKVQDKGVGQQQQQQAPSAKVLGDSVGLQQQQAPLKVQSEGVGQQQQQAPPLKLPGEGVGQQQQQQQAPPELLVEGEGGVPPGPLPASLEVGFIAAYRPQRQPQ